MLNILNDHIKIVEVLKSYIRNMNSLSFKKRTRAFSVLHT